MQQLRSNRERNPVEEELAKAYLNSYSLTYTPPSEVIKSFKNNWKSRWKQPNYLELLYYINGEIHEVKNFKTGKNIFTDLHKKSESEITVSDYKKHLDNVKFVLCYENEACKKAGAPSAIYNFFFRAIEPAAPTFKGNKNETKGGKKRESNQATQYTHTHTNHFQPSAHSRDNVAPSPPISSTATIGTGNEGAMGYHPTINSERKTFLQQDDEHGITCSFCNQNFSHKMEPIVSHTLIYFAN